MRYNTRMLRRQPFSIIFLSVLTVLALALSGVVFNLSRHASVVIEWSTASELDTIGFNIYRGETQDAIAMQINEQMIPAAADALTGSDYQYVDSTVQPGRRYFYWLEDVNASGGVGRNGPIEARASDMRVEWILIGVLFVILAWGWWHLFRIRPASLLVEAANQ